MDTGLGTCTALIQTSFSLFCPYTI